MAGTAGGGEDPLVEEVMRYDCGREVYLSGFYLPWRSARWRAANLVYAALLLTSMAATMAMLAASIPAALEQGTVSETICYMLLLLNNVSIVVSLLANRGTVCRLARELGLRTSHTAGQPDTVCLPHPNRRRARLMGRFSYWLMVVISVAVALKPGLYLLAGRAASLPLPVSPAHPAVYPLQLVVLFASAQVGGSSMAYFASASFRLLDEVDAVTAAARGLPEALPADRYTRVKMLIRHHVKLIRVVGLYQDVTRVQLLVIFTMAALLMASSCAGLLTAQTLSEKVNYFFIFCAITVFMGIVCGMGEMIKTKSDTLKGEVYFLNWYEYDERTKFLIKVFLEQTKRDQHVTTAVTNTPLSMETFATIINSAYSFVNLLLATKST